ncbi:hypothetical protein Tco_0659285, partial [Tanacetum coccineum]
MIVLSTSLQDLPNFGSLFKFKDRMNESIKTAVQLQSDRLRDEAQAENADFINKLDDNIKKIIKEQVKPQVKEQVTKILPRIEKTVNEQLEAEVLTRSSNKPKTSHVVAANLSELELKKILIDKMEKGSKSQNTYTGKSAQAEEPIHADEDLEEPAHQEFDTGFTEDQPIDETTQHHDCNLAQKEDTRDLFNELMDTPLDFSAFVMNRLKVDTSLVELEYFLEEVCKATTDKLDWNNPKGQQYPHDLHKPLPLIPNLQGHHVIPFDHFINNDLAYLRGGSSSQTYATSVMKTKASDYGYVKWIEDLVLNTMWSPVPVIYDKHALWGIYHWGRKRQQFYGFTVNMESAHDVYSRHKIIVVTKIQIVEWHNYKHLDWITVHRNDDMLYKLKEGDYKRLRLQEIKDMLLLLVQG